MLNFRRASITALCALACCVPASSQLSVNTGNLKIEPRYNGQTLDQSNAGYDVAVVVDSINRGRLLFDHSGPAPITSLLLNDLSTGTHTIELQADGDDVAFYSVTVSPGVTTTDAFELSSAMGVVKGSLLVNGAPPSDNSYGICGVASGNNLYVLSPGNSLFRLLTRAGSRSGCIFKNPTGIIKLFPYTTIAGQETDLGSLDAVKSTPTITWANPADIIYGTPLSNTQLNATASVPGSFTYSPSAGTVLNAGNGQTLSVTFTPTDTVNYSTASKTVSINVLKVSTQNRNVPFPAK